MFTWIQGIFIIFIETLCCKLFFEAFSVRRKEIKEEIRGIAILLLVVALFCVSLILKDNYLIKQIVVILLEAATMFLLMKLDLKRALILATMFTGLLLAVDYVTLLVILNCFPDMTVINGSYPVQSVLLIGLDKAILFLVILIIKKKVGKKSSNLLSDTEWLYFLVFPFFTIGIIITMLLNIRDIRNSYTENLLLMIALGLLGMNFYIFYLIDGILQRENPIRENEIFKLQAHNQMEMYRTISENFDKQRKKTHEFKNQILCMDALLNNEDYEELRKYMGTIMGGLKGEKNHINTNHVIVNAILNTKYQEAVEKKIVFVLKFNDLSKLILSDEDIVIILSNLLNNAIEACEKCSNKKIIKLKFVIEENNIILSVKNTYEKEVKYKEGRILTTKEKNEHEHGIGIRNTIDAIEKYGGSYAIKYEDHQFLFSIMIPNE